MPLSGFYKHWIYTSKSHKKTNISAFTNDDIYLTLFAILELFLPHCKSFIHTYIVVDAAQCSKHIYMYMFACKIVLK